MQILHTTSADGTRLRLGRWGEPGRNLLLVHGLAEHLGRYQHVGETLAAAGWRVTAVELRGHGESEGQRGHVQRWIHYVEDVRAAAGVAGADHNPMVAVAHSMGGLVTLSAIENLVHPPIQAVALSNPLLKVATDPPAAQVFAARIASRILPWLPQSSGLSADLISRDPEVVARYEADPLVYGTITPRWFCNVLRAQAAVHAYAGQYDIPLRMMVGTADGICDHNTALQFADAWGGPVVKAVYEGLYHELFNEPEKETVLSELIAWLDGLTLES
ncbi:MAG: acylglycerol lipase [Myxococcota bacterium]|jgi:acylglycerol lipase